MASIYVSIYRGKIIESKHRVACLIKDINNKTVFSTNDENLIVYPRSAIKIFQAMPFLISNAHKLFNLNKEIIAISCSSHAGESRHLYVLENWLKKINVSIKDMKCGIHNPLNEISSNKLLLSGNKPTQLHNNCAGKHLAIISGCIANKMSIKDYININHPYQKLIRNSLEYFIESKIIKKNIGIDGCSLPQYAFPIKKIATSMINLIKEKDKKNKYSEAINIILPAIKQYPRLIGGKNRFDTDLIKITNGRIFCKGGAEGVFLFADFSKKLGGVIKIIDGNYRAIPTITMQLLLKLKLLSNNETKALHKWKKQKIFNHAKKNIGEITSKL